ncbi:hypothetical protein MUO14_23835 [Halobacillus shinanisalinarum]|uniref:Uncharacterized protein n=1 Tax=Halobacillus shinanisalinarum TaxID=2932258 RepID=A0ABY4H8B8_9BACI|nr:hypothetical protein MUO14_23835 [Halobacillus shinanisalinarum]
MGAGTVLDEVTARMAIEAGAQFIVGPNFVPEVAKLCNRYQIVYIPGCQTAKEVIAAMEAGADIVKLFPGNIITPGGLKAMKGPLPQANLMPSGGVSVANVHEWLDNGAVAISVGCSLYQSSQKEVTSASKEITHQL